MTSNSGIRRPSDISVQDHSSVTYGAQSSVSEPTLWATLAAISIIAVAALHYQTARLKSAIWRHSGALKVAGNRDGGLVGGSGGNPHDH